MTERGALALIIPAYNAAGHLPRLLASAAAQTEPFDEIWVYDDASTDETAVVAERLGAKVLRGSVNRGCSFGKNALVAHVSAEWVHFHDADDELMPNFVRLARRWIDDGRHDVVIFPIEERDDSTGRLLATWGADPSELSRDPRAYAIRNKITSICGLYRRDVFLKAGGYDDDPQVLYNEDVAMHIRLAFAGLSFAAEQGVSIINHRRTGSMSAANQLECIRAHYQVMRKTAARTEAAPYAADIAAKLWGAAGVLAAYLDWETADAALALARRLSPTFTQGSTPFRALAAVSPPLALRVRETLIRRLRPSLRRGYPDREPEFPVAELQP